MTDSMERGLTVGRRGFAAGVVGVGGVSLAGCAGADGSEDSGASGGGVVLSEVSAVNFDDDPHEFRLLVERDGEIVHWESYSTATEDGTSPYRRTITPELPAEPGDVTLHVRVADERAQAGFNEGSDTGCLDARIVYDPAAEPPLRVFQSASACPDERSRSE